MMTPQAGPAPARQEGGPGFRADLVYLGWAAAAHPDPGPPPAPLAVPVPDQVSPDWLAAQHREHARLTRPARLAGPAGLAVAAAAAGTGMAAALPAAAALAAGAAGLAVAARGGMQLARGRAALAGQLRAEQQRVAAFAAVQRDEHAVRQREFARQVRGWQQRAAAYARAPQWHPVTLPVSTGRLDVAGGTLAGWSALVTTLALARLAAGGEVTVLDLSEGDAAADLVALARRQGARPLVWRLPGDLSRLDLGTDFPPGPLADVLARTVAAAAGPGADDAADKVAGDAALLRRVMTALGDGDCGEPAPLLAQLLAALRVTGQIGEPPGQPGGVLTGDQVTRLVRLAGTDATRLAVERAWAMEARLAALAPLGTAPVSPPASALRVVTLAGQDSAAGDYDALAAYLVIALTAALRKARPGARWAQAVILLGAERLPAGVADRLYQAAEAAGAGLVTCYRSIPAPVRDRLGRGDAAVAFMRLGNAADAKVAAEQIGTEHRFVISQLTQTVGTSVSDTAGDSQTATSGTSDSAGDSWSLTRTQGRSRGRGASRGGFAPFGGTGSASRDRSMSAALSDSVSVTAGINTGTSWGVSTSKSLGTSDSVAAAAQRAREFLVEARELQQLPASAVVVCAEGPDGAPVQLADANPAIWTLPTASLALPGSVPRAAPDDQEHLP